MTTLPTLCNYGKTRLVNNSNDSYTLPWQGQGPGNDDTGSGTGNHCLLLCSSRSLSLSWSHSRSRAVCMSHKVELWDWTLRLGDFKVLLSPQFLSVSLVRSISAPIPFPLPFKDNETVITHCFRLSVLRMKHGAETDHRLQTKWHCLYP